MNLTDTHGDVKTVNFNLDDMGTTPRTMSNVVTYLNSQLAAAGAVTRFKDVDTPAAADTTTVNGQTVTLSTLPDNYALQIVGTDTEAVTFTAPTTTPAVYVTATSGTAAVAATSTTAAVAGDQTQNLLKFNTGTSDPTTSLVNNSAMQSAVSSALASATGPDGSLYVVSNVDATTADGQTINGTQDVALMKYDSAGNLMYTRTLGAANSATGYAIAVSPDGTNVAVAGSVTGALDGSDPGQTSTSTNSFVTEYSAAEGDEQWTAMQPRTPGDARPAWRSARWLGLCHRHGAGLHARRRKRDRRPGRLSQELQPQRPAHLHHPVRHDREGHAGGHRRLRLQHSTSPAARAAMRWCASSPSSPQARRPPERCADLGALQQGGNVVGVGVNADGSVVVAGSTTNGRAVGRNRDPAPISRAREGFVATLGANLQASSSDSLSYLATSGDLTASAMTLSGGQVYLAGKLATTAPVGSGLTNTTAGYVAAVDPISGGVTWSQQFQGAD